MKKVLILMSTYNGEKWLKEQIDSILDSRDVKVDILVRDDGSSDATLSILNSYKKHDQLNYYVGENIGPAQSFRDLIDKCKFGYDAYAYADQDDIWSENKLNYATEALEMTDVPCLWACGLRKFGNETGGVYCSEERANSLESILMTFGTSNGCCMVFNESLLKLLKKTPMGMIDMHDSWTNCICVAYGGKAIIDTRELVSYRIHSSNVLGYRDSLKKKIQRGIHPKCLRSQTAKLVLECEEKTKYGQLLNLYSQPKPLKNRILLLKRKKPDAVNLSELLKFKIQIALGKY